MKIYNIFHTEKNRSAGLAYGHPGLNDTRREGPPDGFETREVAEEYMREMQAQARANNAGAYADSLHVEPADYA